LRPTRGLILGSAMGRTTAITRRGRGPVWPREVRATSPLPRYGSRRRILVAILLGRRKWIGTRHQPLGQHFVQRLTRAAERSLWTGRDRRGPLPWPALRRNRGWPRPAVAGSLRFVVAARIAARFAHVARLAPASAIHVARRLAAPRRSLLGRATPPCAARPTRRRRIQGLPALPPTRAMGARRDQHGAPLRRYGIG